mgnify:CR=1 FL=1
MSKRISKSSLATYTFCPYQYKLSYIHRLPSIESEAMVKGTNVHSIDGLRKEKEMVE